MDETDFFRGYARDVAVDPAIDGADNVQDALAGAGGAAIPVSASTNTAVQDTPTALTGDGDPHLVTCVVAAPPAWMDTGGQIIAAGLYQIVTAVTATAGPTTPGQYILVETSPAGSVYLSCDALDAAGEADPTTVLVLVTADLPVLATATVTMPTDVTEAVTVTITVIRLASSTA